MQELPTPVCLGELVLQPHDLRALLRGDLPQRGVGLLHRGEVLAVLLLRAADKGPLLGKGAVFPGGKKKKKRSKKYFFFGWGECKCESRVL